MKKFLLLLAVSGCYSTQVPPPPPVPPPPTVVPVPVVPAVPQTALDSALANAKKAGKPVYLFVGETGCPPCAVMRAHALREADMSRVVFLESKDEREIWRKFRIEAFPTSILLDGDGKELKRTIGLMTTNELQRWLP